MTMKNSKLCAVFLSLILSGLTRGQGVEDRWLRLEPSVHINAALGWSSTDEVEELALGHHDPTREEGTLQGLELGLSMWAGDYLEGFATYTVHYGAEEEWEDELEEAFLKLVNIPGGFEVRGGRILARYGQLNAVHLHGWNTVDIPLVLGRFLGDDGLILDGGDVLWQTKARDTHVMAMLGYGQARSHEHEDHMHHDEHEGHEGHEGQGDHDAHEPLEEAAHHHKHDEGTLNDDTVYARIMARHRPSDFIEFEGGYSIAGGENGYGRDTLIHGLDFAVTWRKDGMDPNSLSLRWNTELLYRRVETEEAEHAEDEHDGPEHGHALKAHDHDHEHGDIDHGDIHQNERIKAGEFGFYSEVTARTHPLLDLGLRLGYIEGNDKLGTEERTRVSPVLTAWLNREHKAMIRLQYNHDKLEHGREDTVWLQAGFSWGGTEIR